MKPRRRRPLLERLQEQYEVNAETGCWEWTGSLNHGGYGQFTIDGVRHPAHRAAWMILVGPDGIDGLDIDHLCRNRKCVNPEHLEPTTRSVNLSRGIGGRWRTERITHCPQGHPYDEENTYRDRKGRQCRACHRTSNREYARRKAAERAKESA